MPAIRHDFSRIPVHPSPLAIQTKLTINTPGDEYEQEADRVAEQVMRMPEPQVQRKCACGGTCSDCQKEDADREHRGMQLKRVSSNVPGPTEAPPIVHEVLRSSGQPLDVATRAFMETRFGHDFSGVRVHSDSAAAESARAVGARAFASGRHVVFGSSLYTPHTTPGRALLAHELAHTLQQSGTPLVQRTPIHKESDKEYARTLGKADADRIRQAGTITENDRVEMKGLLEYFRGPAREAYLKEISPAILDVRHPEIEMPAIAKDAAAKTATPADQGTFNDPRTSPRYIDNIFEGYRFGWWNGATVFYWTENGVKHEVGIPLKDWRQDDTKSYVPLMEVHKSRFEAEASVFEWTFSTDTDSQFFSFYVRPDGIIMPTSFSKDSTPKFHEMWSETRRWFKEQAADVSKAMQDMGNAINPIPCTKVDKSGVSPSFGIWDCALPLFFHWHAHRGGGGDRGTNAPDAPPPKGKQETDHVSDPQGVEPTGGTVDRFAREHGIPPAQLESELAELEQSAGDPAKVQKPADPRYDAEVKTHQAEEHIYDREKDSHTWCRHTKVDCDVPVSDTTDRKIDATIAKTPPVDQTAPAPPPPSKRIYVPAPLPAPRPRPVPAAVPVNVPGTPAKLPPGVYPEGHSGTKRPTPARVKPNTVTAKTTGSASLHDEDLLKTRGMRRQTQAYPRAHQHHVFPQELKAWFDERFKGTEDIHEYTVYISQGEHEAVHAEGKGGTVKGVKEPDLIGWNQEWKSFRDAHPAATPQEIFEEAGRLMAKYGFSDAVIDRYQGTGKK